MINKLTKEQREKLKEYAKQGVERGLSCDPIDEKAAQDYSLRLMQWLGRDYFGTVIVDSPLAACYACSCIKVIENIISGNIGDQVGDQVWAQVGFIWPHLDGQWYSYYSAWHNYFRDIVKIELPDIWVIEEQVQFGCVYPMSNFVVISRRPLEINLNTSGRLHGNGSAAIKYADGFSVYSLNGVRVPEWLAIENENNIDPRKFAELENAEIRREFIRKVGIERVYHSCGGVVVDSQGDYEVVNIDLGGATGRCPYLKMKNPSIGVWHLEGIPKGTKTVKEALYWRNQSDLMPVQLT